MVDPQLYVWSGVWLIAMAVILFALRRSAVSTGLMLAYVFQMFILHWLGAAVYLLPWYWNSDVGIVFAGLRESTFGMAGMAVGAVPVLYYLQQRQVEPQLRQNAVADTRLIRAYIVAGAISYFVLLPLVGQVATLTSVISVGASLVVVGLCLGCWNAYRRKTGALVYWLLASAALPVLTMLLQGFLSFGAAALVAVFAFVASFYRPRWHVALLAVIVAWGGLSIYVTYMRDRTEIRRVVWGGRSMSERVDQAMSTFLEPEIFDITKVEHLQRIDIRLNQNFLVGASVAWLKTRSNQFAHGETIQEAFTALVPRVLWPGKPIFAGSGNLVSRFTGMYFPDGTSVGIGQVMEFYVNFGSFGVFFGFICFGAIVAYVDARAARARDLGDWASFCLWFLPGLGLLQAGGSLVEVTSGAAAALVVAVVFNRFSPSAAVLLTRQRRPKAMMRATRNRRLPQAEAPLS